MKFLFVDTETSGLSPQKGQIIEIAGVLAELDTTSLKFTVLSEFEQTVALRSTELDERVTRITGITEEELRSADSISKVQENWSTWLETLSPEGAYIVGHSVDFDMAFLKAESWLLPDNYKTLDTLEVVKILMPEASAINLEYLVQRYSLSPQQRESRTTSKLKAHRALYDTLCCMHLLQLLLYKLKELPASQEFYEVFAEFFDLPLQFYAKPAQSFAAPQLLALNKIGFDGELIQPNLYQKINLLGTEETTKKASELFQLHYLPRKLKIIALQLYTLCLAKIQGEGTVKYHGRDQVDYTFFEVLLDTVLDLDQPQDSMPALEKFESIVTHIRSISEKNFKLGKLMAYLEIYTMLVPDATEVQKVLSSYDFFLITIQPFWKRSEFMYKPFDLKPEEQLIRTKIGQLATLLHTLFDLEWSQEGDILKQLVASIKSFLQELKDEEGNLFVRANNAMTFRFWSNQIFVSQPFRDFRLNSSLERVLLKKEPVITTCYNETDFWKFLEITGTKRVLENYPKLQYSSDPDFVMYTSERKLKIFYVEQIALAKEAKKPVIVLCGQNSGLRDAEKILTAGGFDPGDYLILGDTGSLTKIASKVAHGFVGVVVVKVNDFDYFGRMGLIDYAQIWILCQPYFVINNYWYQLARRSGNKDEFMKIFKFLYLKAVASKIYQKTHTTVNFQKGYSI